MNRIPNTLVVRLGKRATSMLVEFANCLSDEAAFQRFRRRWERVSPLKWEGDHKSFLLSQGLVREIWEGKKKGIEWLQVMLNLGIELESHPAEEGERIVPPPIGVDWDNSQVFLRPRNLEDLVWLVLLQNSRRLSICANKENGCLTPYFLRYRRRQKFCCDACALPRQREHKRRWWAEHGKEWQRERKKNSKPGRRKTQ